jgi:hypothetical protein
MCAPLLTEPPVMQNCREGAIHHVERSEYAVILANTRGQLRAGDLDLVILLLSRGSGARRKELERRLEREGPDPLLDAPELPERLMAVRTPCSGPRCRRLTWRTTSRPC